MGCDMGDNKILGEKLNFLFEIGNIRKFRFLLQNLPASINKIDAAVAYTTEKRLSTDISLVDICVSKNIKLNWWGLFNADGGSAISEIKKALEHPDLITFYPFSKNFHSKVIYFHGYGIYIGSHNFTYNALMNNVEAGVFVEETALTEKQKTDINDFFDYLKEKSIPAVQDDIEKILEYEDLTQSEKKQQKEIRNRLENYFDAQFSHMFRLKEGVQTSNETADDTQKKREFLQEWRSTQNIIEYIKLTIKEKCRQPEWINKDAELSIVTDQLLHAYYYSYILHGNDERNTGRIMAEQKEQNKNNTERAVLNAIQWWETLKSAPTNEDTYINKWGYENQKILLNLKTRKLTEEELEIVMLQNHAATTHARQIPNQKLGLPSDNSTTQEERVRIYAKWLYVQKSEGDLDINDVMKYLLFDNNDTIENRVYNCVNNRKYKIEHFGKSIIGELVGWGRPDITHIRNNRVNKVLNCLGFDVELFSD